MATSGPRVIYHHQLQKRRKPRKRPPVGGRPELSLELILEWADACHERTGRWPRFKEGRIPESLDDGWNTVDNALRVGCRGLAKGGSLARLLAEHRGVRNPRSLPQLTTRQILSWADAHHKRTGSWPQYLSGKIPESPGETWNAVEGALRKETRGLRKEGSLAQLLAKHRGVRNVADLPPLTIPQILAWADSHHKRTGGWPKMGDGPITDAPGETWSGVQSALRAGVRGLRGGESLAQLLDKRRGVRNRKASPRLSAALVLKWADAHQKRTGTWPTTNSGTITDAHGETWAAVDSALQVGGRGLRSKSSLARLLAKHRGVRNRTNLPQLTVPRILRWADAHHERTGQWPRRASGAVVDASGETWAAVDSALLGGSRGLPGGSSLPRLLAERRGIPNPAAPPRLTPEIILNWADMHHRRTGGWPHVTSGPIVDASGETWSGMESALQTGGRGLGGGSSLARFLAEHRGVRNPRGLPRLNPARILKWADAHKRRTGKWPKNGDGPIADAPGETWEIVQAALSQGRRGLSKGSSLARLLAEHRGVRNSKGLPCLSPALILKWVDAHHRRFGTWPKKGYGPIVDAPGETWSGVDSALQAGGRGQSGHSTLAQLLRQHGRG